LEVRLPHFATILQAPSISCGAVLVTPWVSSSRIDQHCEQVGEWAEGPGKLPQEMSQFLQ
jgi:hypothetical protein